MTTMRSSISANLKKAHAAPPSVKPYARPFAVKVRAEANTAAGAPTEGRKIVPETDAKSQTPKFMGNVVPATNVGAHAPPPEKERPALEVSELQVLQDTMKRAREAFNTYSTYSQEKVDQIFKAAATAANQARIPLARMAVNETGMGVLEDKVIKNHFASEYIYNKYKNERTAGVIERDPSSGITKIAEPVGVIAGIVPTTNPTSTAIFKALLALKTRNALVISPHPRAAKATIEAARIVRDAAVEAGAPANIISWIENPTLPMSQALMQHPDISLILATGGPAMVRAAYASSHPAIGVGAGNTPAVMDDTCDVKMAVSSVLISKTFDNGVICASEQSVVVMDKIYEEVKKEFQLRGAYFLTPEEVAKVGPQIIKDGRLNANIVGQSAEKLGSMFGLNVPKGTKVLIGEVKEIGASEPFAYEKLCPILGMYRAGTYDEAVSMADKLIQFGGPGHTSVLYTDPRNTESIAKFNSTVKTARILINTPASQGAIGDLYNFHMDPSLTLGCGTWGSTSVSTNVGPQHLLNVKTVGERRQNMLWFRVPSKIYFKGGSLEVALRELSTKHRVFVVTDKPLYDIGVANKVTDVLDEMGVKHQVYYQVEPDPTIANIERGVHEINQFQPDAIVAIGGGSPMDAAKVMWMMYEQPQVKFEGVAMRFMDIRKRVYELPELGAKAQLICVPTTSGTGSEVTPFAVVTDQNTGVKYPLADYALTPSMAIVDPQLVMSMPKKLTAYGGVDALTHALESYVSVCATDYTRALSKEAISSLFKYLPRAYHDGKTDYEAREKVHYAATIAGMAFANAFLGICHSLAHKLGSNMHIPHGLANAALISHVVKYNATDAPYKQATFSQYEYPRAKRDYAEIAEYLGLCAKDASDEEKVKALVKSIEDLKAAVEIPPTIREICGAEREGEYMAKLDDMSDNAFDDQCTGANPRYPLINDLRQLLLDAWDKPIMSLL